MAKSKQQLLPVIGKIEGSDRIYTPEEIADYTAQKPFIVTPTLYPCLFTAQKTQDGSEESA